MEQAKSYDWYVAKQRLRQSGATIVVSVALIVLVIVAAPLIAKLLQLYDTSSTAPLEFSTGSVHFERISLDATPQPQMRPVTVVQTVAVNKQEMQLGGELYGPVPAGMTCTIHPKGMLVELSPDAGPDQAYYIADQSRKLLDGECEHKYVFDMPR